MLMQKAFFVPFLIGSLVIAVLLWQYWSRNPIRQLRPPFGQILLFAIVLFGMNAAVSFLLAKTILSGSDVARSIEESKEQRGGDFGRRPDNLPASSGGSWDRIMPGRRGGDEEE